MTTAEKIYEKLKNAPAALAQEVLDFVEFLQARQTNTSKDEPDSFDEFFGALKDSGVFNGDPAAIQRELRNEWA